MSSTETVTLVVGTEQKQFIVHKELICAKSEYFAKTFREDTFKEGKEKTIYLPGVWGVIKFVQRTPPGDGEHNIDFEAKEYKP